MIVYVFSAFCIFRDRAGLFLVLLIANMCSLKAFGLLDARSIGVVYNEYSGRLHAQHLLLVAAILVLPWQQCIQMGSHLFGRTSC
jgi:hypothetical protein